jgi:hypothetical protein
VDPEDADCCYCAEEDLSFSLVSWWGGGWIEEGKGVERRERERERTNAPYWLVDMNGEVDIATAN